MEQKTYDFYGQKLTITELREGYAIITGCNNGDELSDEELYLYMLEACEEK